MSNYTVKEGDTIVGINGESTAKMSMDAVANNIRGPLDTEVELELKNKKGELRKVKVVRKEIKTPSLAPNPVRTHTEKLLFLHKSPPNQFSILTIHPITIHPRLKPRNLHSKHIPLAPDKPIQAWTAKGIRNADAAAVYVFHSAKVNVQNILCWIRIRLALNLRHRHLLDRSGYGVHLLAGQFQNLTCRI